MLVILQILKESVFVAKSVNMPSFFYSLNRILNCFIITFLLAFTAIAQQVKPDKSSGDLTGITREFYGTDDVLVNGQKYIPSHFLADGNPYFPSETWTKGTLKISGTLYENVDLMYNAETDQVVLRTRLNNGDTIFVARNILKTEAFDIGGHTFTRLLSTEINQQSAGFYEEVYRGNFVFLTKHQKTFIADYSKTSPNGHFSKLISTNYIYQNGQLFKVTSQKSFLSYFSQNSKAIKAFMKKNNIRYAKANLSTMKLLLQYCDDLSSGKI
jgi:hypothetical protein